MPARSRHRARRPAREATMQMTLRHAQGRTLFRRPFFTLWTRFDLTPEESQLISRYRMADAVLSEGDDVLSAHARNRSKWYAIIVMLLVFAWAYWHDPGVFTSSSLGHFVDGI